MDLSPCFLDVLDVLFLHLYCTIKDWILESAAATTTQHLTGESMYKLRSIYLREYDLVR